MQILTAFALLIPAFSLLYTPQPLALLFHRVYNAPLPNTLLYCLRGAAAPLETQEKRPSTTLLVLGQCADPLAHSLDQRNDKRIPHGEIAQSFRHPGCPIIREAVEPFAFDGR